MMKERKTTALRAAALILAILFVLLAAVACADKTNEGTGTSAPAKDTDSPAAGTQSDTVAVETEPVVTDEYGREVIEDGLPAEADLQGRQFTVHTRGNVDKYEWTAPEQNGEILNDAIYRRNTNVEERYKIKLNVIAEGTYKDYSQNLDKVKASIKSGDGAYDLLCGYSTPIASMATTGLILNLKNVPYLDFDKPWWSRGFTDEFTISDTLYFGAGSLSIAMIYSMECIFFNTKILNEVAQDYSVYKTVDNLEWTWEELTRVGQLAYIPDASGARGSGERFGFSSREVNNGNLINGFFYSSGTKLITRDGDGNLVLNEDMTKLSDIIEQEVNFLYNTPSNYPLDMSTPIDFKNDKTLFCFSWLYYGQTDFAKEMDDYGIVPMPMLNKEQGRYYTPVQGGLHMYAIPYDVTSKEEVGMITEALAAESYRVLIPAYYEVVLKTRYAKDSQTSSMIDLMYETVTFDIGFTYNGSIRYLSALQDAVKAKNTSAASTSVWSRQSRQTQS